MPPTRTLPRLATLLLALVFFSASVHAQTLSGSALVQALQHGGYVLVLRHASSPAGAPAAGAADPGNVGGQRQLDSKGQSTATAMGDAFRRLHIPIGALLSSPTFRALQTIRYARLGTPQTPPELGDNGKSMQGGTEAQARWLRNAVTQAPANTNTVIVTHNPNILAAFPEQGTGLADGEALIFQPDGKGAANVVARVLIEDWPSLHP